MSLFCGIILYGGDIINNNNGCTFIKFRIDDNLNTAFKSILEKAKITQQDLLEKLVKEYVLSNLNLLISKDNK